jgi:hypothetical protein
MHLSNRGRLFLAAFAVSCGLLAPASAGAVSFGIADAPSSCTSWASNSCNTWGYGFASYYNGPATAAFTMLRQNLPLHYVRLFAPYDAVEDSNPATQSCRYSYDYTSHTSSQYPHGGGPGSAWFRLAQEIKDARSVGLTPLVALTTATSDGQQQDGDPATPDPTAASSAGPAAVTTAAGQDYMCGAEGLTYLVHSQGLPVGQWEAWNEPDGSSAYNGALTGACAAVPNNCGGVYEPSTGLCGSTTYTQCGPLEAAGLYSDLQAAQQLWNSRYGWAISPAAAATLAWPSTGYFNAYINQLTTVLGQWPQYISFHAYADVTSGGHAQSLAFTKDIYNRYNSAGKPQPALWISETGVVPTDGDTSYSGAAVTCSNGEADDASTLGACVDGNPTAQQTDANDFLNLATTGSYSPGQITELFWFQLQPANASTGWDSGLLAPPRAPAGNWAQASPDGIYGSNLGATGMRQSFCVLARLPSSSCSSAPVEASDWSIQPRTVTGLLTQGQVNVSGLIGSQSGLANGAFVTGPGIPPDTVISTGAGTSAWALSKAATASGSVSLTASG